MTIRPYDPDDRDACIAIFNSNTPKFFARRDSDAFLEFLSEPECELLVLLNDSGRIVALGGWYVKADKTTGGLCWGMVEALEHRRGFGTALLQERLRRMKAAGAERAVIHTSQHSQSFYARHGFRVDRALQDGLSPGIDDIEMELELR